MISANGVEYKNVPEQVQYLTEQVADIWTAIEGINPPDLTLYALKTYVDAADSALGTRITAVENSIGTLLTKTEAANTYAKIADIGTYINLSDYVKTVDMYTYVQSEIQNFDLDSNTDFTALKSRVSTLESSVSSMTSDIADANTTAANAQTAAGNAVNTANNASAVATNAYNTATNAASDVAEMQTTINNYDSRIDAVESTVDGFQTSLTTAQNTANVALTKAESALSMIAGLHSLTKQEEEFEGDNVTVTGFVEGSLCTLSKLEGNTKASSNLFNHEDFPNRKFNYSDNVFSNSAVDTRDFFNLQVIGFNFSNEIISTYFAASYSSAGSYSFDFVVSGDDVQYLLFKHNGQTTDLYISRAYGITPGKTYTLSFECLGCDPTTIGGIRLKNVMLNEGSTALDYVPYFDGLKSVSISGLSSGGGVVITTSEGTTSLVPTLDDDTLELRMLDYLEQTISGTSIITSIVRESGIVDLGDFDWTINEQFGYVAYNATFANEVKKPTNVNTKPNAIASNLDIDTQAQVYGGHTTNSLAIATSGALYVSTKTTPTGYLVYERATPVTTVLATVTYTDVSAFFEVGATITVNNANTEYGVESTSTMYGYVAE